jgi:quinol-cytochrome oxidoreductase complex cytochrome b subunit
MFRRLKELKKNILESQVWRSMFRHDYADTPRNRTLQIMSNVWMHLHPPKIRRHAIRIRFTWCMGGITFLLFLVLTVTGVVLMFYYGRWRSMRTRT